MVTIYTNDSLLPEKQYTFHVVFREMLGIDYVMAIQSDEQAHRIELPNGATLLIGNHFGNRDQRSNPNNNPAPVPHPFQPDQQIIGLFGPALFELGSQRIVCELDLFAAVFFMLSRWEETDANTLDVHGRFPAEQSLAFRAGFLHRPVVNEWADLIWDMLVRLGWSEPRPSRHFKIDISCDVDHPQLWWSVADRLRTLGGAVFKRHDFQEALYFVKNHFFTQKDPYDVFDEWMDILASNQLVAQFNFMGARSRDSDCWYPLEHPFVQQLMKKIARRGHRIGFHPSYEAFEDQTVFERELASLRAVSPMDITSGRQHYLRFSALRTWQMWDASGLAVDSTLGYPEAEGFRCGICHDFPVFDLKARKMCSLRENPLIAMDVTLAQYRRYTPEQGAERLQQLRREVVKHGGDFTLLWHNSSWNTAFWDPWKQVFKDFMAG